MLYISLGLRSVKHLNAHSAGGDILAAPAQELGFLWSSSF